MIGLLITVVFVALLAKAILETIWGLCMIVQSLFWHSIALVLGGLALLIDGYRRCRPSRTRHAH